MQKHNLLFLIGFLSIVLGGCASQPLRLPDAESEPAAATAPLIHVTDRASGVALQALAYLGTPYRTGGLSPRTGFDCSATPLARSVTWISGAVAAAGSDSASGRRRGWLAQPPRTMLRKPIKNSRLCFCIQVI